MYTYNRQPAGLRSSRASQVVISHHLGQPQPQPTRARQIYASQSKVKQLTDANFSNIFHDRNKVAVVSFWADSCRPCDGVAKVMAFIADKYGKGQFAGLVNFFHAQSDPKVNPKLYQRFGFKESPVIYFYYTSTGKPPTKGAPLLEGSLGGDKRQYDPEEYNWRIKSILGQHGHLPTTSETRGWKTSRYMVSSDDFGDIDKILVERSPYQLYFQSLYRAHPGARFSRAAHVLDRDSFNQKYQNINGRLPGRDVLGTVDKQNGRVYLLSLNIQLQAYLLNAVHEAVHFFSCPMQGPGTRFHVQYGHNVTEGFTEFIAEEILKSQKVRIVSPSYPEERAVAVALIQVVGIQAMTDDYFRCTRRVIEILNRRGVAGEFTRLRFEADRLDPGAAKTEALQRLRRYLASVRRPKCLCNARRIYMRIHNYRGSYGLGWTIDRQFGQQSTPTGHETLTDMAASGIVQNAPDLAALRGGARLPDLADPLDHILQGEEKRHVLRRPKQRVADALREAVDHLVDLHRRTLAATSTNLFGLIGEAMHLIQDSYSPAHVRRDSTTRRIIDIRQYCDPLPGIFSFPLRQKHACKIDARDNIFTTPQPGGTVTLTSEATEAIAASQEYLLMVLKQVSPPLPKPAGLILKELDAFIARHLQLTVLLPGARGPAVRDLQRRLNRWRSGSNIPPLPLSGVFGTQTKQVVVAFQRAKRLMPDGAVGPRTWAGLPQP